MVYILFFCLNVNRREDNIHSFRVTPQEKEDRFICFENLKSKHQELLQFLKTENYSTTTIHIAANEITVIIENAEEFGWQTYQDIYHTYEAQDLSKDVLRSKRHCLRMLKRFDVQGEFPDRTRRSYVFESDVYENLPDEFKELILFYLEDDLIRGKKQTTIYHETLNAVTFLCAMQQRGCSRLEEIKEKDVLSFFLSEDGRLIRGCSYKKNVAAVFKAGLHWKEQTCRRILTCFPALHEKRKTIQHLTNTEIDRIRGALHNKDSRLSLRDRAVGTLLLYTGMRGCDIAGLLFQSVDWDKEILSVVQRKTAVPMELPLTPVIGNALFDYVDSERPLSDDEHKIKTLYLLPRTVAHLKKYLHEFHGDAPCAEAYLFYSRNTGIYGKLTAAAEDKMLKKHAKTAHTECTDVPLGLHAHQLRHAKASHWLEDGMNIVQISFLLGHEQIRTTMVYLDITTEDEAKALATLEGDHDSKTEKKWKRSDGSLRGFCGLPERKS